MSKINLLPFVALLCLLFMGCEAESPMEASEQNKTLSFNVSSRYVNPLFDRAPETPCTEVNLIAGQNYDAGSVMVSADDTTVYVTYKTAGNWYINATHLYAGDCNEIPQNGAGNPRIGHFDYSSEHTEDTNEVVFEIDTTTLDECFCIAAHAEVELRDNEGNVIQSETAWAEGLDFEGNSWAMYFDFCKRDCPDEDDGSNGGDNPRDEEPTGDNPR